MYVPSDCYVTLEERCAREPAFIHYPAALFSALLSLLVPPLLYQKHLFFCANLLHVEGGNKMLLDPTIVFTVGVVLVPCVFLLEEPSLLVQYLTTPMMLVSLVFLGAVLLLTHSGPCVQLSSRDRRVANWFLMNGVYFNLFLDVISGQMQMMDEMSTQYLKVEPRYQLGLDDDAGSTVFMTSALEFFFQSPLCLITYYAYYRGKSYRRLTELTVCILHSSGVWYFYFPEAMRNFPHLGGWPQGHEIYSFDRLLFFWFGFWFCGILWLVVPFFIGKSAWVEICSIVSSVETKKQR